MDSRSGASRDNRSRAEVGLSGDPVQTLFGHQPAAVSKVGAGPHRLPGAAVVSSDGCGQPRVAIRMSGSPSLESVPIEIAMTAWGRGRSVGRKTGFPESGHSWDTRDSLKKSHPPLKTDRDRTRLDYCGDTPSRYQATAIFICKFSY